MKKARTKLRESFLQDKDSLMKKPEVTSSEESENKESCTVSDDSNCEV